MVRVLAVLSNSQKMVHRITYHTLPLGTLGFKTMCAEGTEGTDCLADDANCICSFFSFSLTSSSFLLLNCHVMVHVVVIGRMCSLLNFDSMVCTQVLCYILATCI